MPLIFPMFSPNTGRTNAFFFYFGGGINEYIM